MYIYAGERERKKECSVGKLTGTRLLKTTQQHSIQKQIPTLAEAEKGVVVVSHMNMVKRSLESNKKMRKIGSTEGREGKRRKKTQ